MENEENKDINLQNDETNPEEESQDEAQDESNDFDDLKARLEKLEAENASFKRENKKLKKQNVSKKDSSDGESDELDYGQLSFLEQKGIDTSDESQLDLVRNALDSTGKELKDVINTKWFQEDLETLRAKSAMPKSSNRSGEVASDTVEYYLAKDQLPPADKPELRKEYLSRKKSKAAYKNKFSDNPIAR